MPSSATLPPRRGKVFALRTALVGVTCIGLVGGFAQVAHAAIPTGPSSTGLTGSRPSATSLPFRISDQVSASVDVATGNLLVSTQGLALPGVNSTIPLGQTYNSLGWQTGSNSTAAAYNWSLGLASAGSLSLVGTNVVYTGGDGVTWKFTPVSGSTTGAYTSPAGFKQDLVKGTGTTGYTLTDRTSRQVVTFNTDGVATSVADRNGNKTTLNDYAAGVPATVVSTAGPSGSRTAALNFNPSTLATTITQTADQYNTRTVKYQKDSSGNLTGFTDAAGNTTTFAYSGHDLTSITGPTGAVTSFTYSGTTHTVTRIDQQNTTAGSPGTSTTRLTYPSATQTLVAGPNTDASVAVATVDHTTYSINSSQELVNKAVDAAGRERSSTYTANADTATATVGATGAAGTGTSSGTYGANSGNSLTKSQAPGGASTSTTYGSTTSTAYLPASTTDADGNKSIQTFNGAGNQLTNADASGATATLTYNDNGTVDTALAPGNGTNKTVYTYNANKQLSTVTPVTITGTALGVKTYTYDSYGRKASETDGRGNTTRYTYDKDDRLLTTALADGSATVTNTYDAAGNLTKSVSPTGTISNTFDQLNRQLTTANTAGGSETYTYDQASNQVSSADSFGTYTNTFDPAGKLTSTTYPKGSGTQVVRYKTDDQGRRTDTWLQSSNTANTTWAAHELTSYDTSGRVKELKSFTGTGDSSNTLVFDTVYCYNSASAAPTCGTDSTADHAKLQWTKDTTTGLANSGQLTKYTYDTQGRLTKVAQSGGAGTNSTYTYAYDARGNRTSAVVTGSNPSTQSLAYNAANQITTAGYSYDATGNLTAAPGATYTYNGFQQMTAAKNTATGVSTNYTYAGADQKALLSAATDGGRSYNYTYGKNDQQGNPQLTTNTSNGNGAHVYSDPITGQALMLTTSSDIDALYVWDGIGNPVGLLTDFATNSFSYSYDPYGVQALTAGGTGNGAGQNPYAFKAGVTDRASGLVKFGIRWYEAETGTWTQRDTLDAPLDPSNANRYQFAGGDPVNGSDPTGQAISACGATAAVAGIAGFALAAGALVLSPFTAGLTLPLVAAGLGVGSFLFGATGAALGVYYLGSNGNC
ncbi:RHS repeat-associated protein [Frondihabitans sp. PhB161]|nr:RHS repeat-associated protein [Frondihabitans sp. PhB153]RPF08184.1 RHS repeat-associated protein [Frondihabitans sp. PhB161]